MIRTVLSGPKVSGIEGFRIMGWQSTCVQSHLVYLTLVYLKTSFTRHCAVNHQYYTA